MPPPSSDDEVWIVDPDNNRVLIQKKAEETQICVTCFFRKPRSEFGPSASTCNPCKIEMGQEPE